MVGGDVGDKPDGSGGSSPECIEHDLLVRDAQFRLRNGFPRGVDDCTCPDLGDKDANFPFFATGNEVQLMHCKIRLPWQNKQNRPLNAVIWFLVGFFIGCSANLDFT
jgi:hypothetical protein